MLESYKRICWGIAIVAFAYPILIYLNGLAFGFGLQDSISDYFFAPIGPNPDEAKAIAGVMRDPWNHPARTLFVGGLFAIGVFLTLYKGSTDRESTVLNVAGALAVGVAIFPMQQLNLPLGLSPHGICAVGLFLCMGYIAILGQNNATKLFERTEDQDFFQVRYKWIARLMTLFVLLGWGLNVLLGTKDTLIFFVESAGVWIFSYYWWVKSTELPKLVEMVRTRSLMGIAPAL
jgi:hypothetical protein